MAQPPTVTSRPEERNLRGNYVRRASEWLLIYHSPAKKNPLTSPGLTGIYAPCMAFPEMLRVRQTFPRQRVPNIPLSVAETLGRAGLSIKRGDTVAVGAGSRGIANIDVIVGATVRYLVDLGARPFVFPAMGSHGGGTADGQIE